MPRSHKRSQDVAALREAVAPVQLKRHDALKILADEQMELLVDAINRFAGVATYATAAHVVKTEPCYQLLCDTCRWTLDMICPECPGCGCHNGSCDGWRHSEYSGEDPTGFSDAEDDDDWGMDWADCDPEGEWRDSYDRVEGKGAVPEEEYDLDDDLTPPNEEPDEPDWPDDHEPAEPVSAGGWGGSYSEEAPF
jgi:hypothetical protein